MINSINQLIQKLQKYIVYLLLFLIIITLFLLGILLKYKNDSFLLYTLIFLIPLIAGSIFFIIRTGLNLKRKFILLMNEYNQATLMLNDLSQSPEIKNEDIKQNISAFISKLDQTIENNKSKKYYYIENVTYISLLVTNIKKILYLLRKSEDFLETVQKIAHIGRWEYNLKNGEVIWSDGVFYIYGLPRQRMTFEKVISRHNQEDNEKFMQILEQAAQNNTIAKHDLRIYRPDGTERIIHAEAEIKKDNEGNLEKYYGFIQDITEQKKAEQELIRYRYHLEELVKIRTQKLQKEIQERINAEAELQSSHNQLKRSIQNLKKTQAQLIQSEKMASLGILTAGIAHEINNPVNYTKSAISALKEDFQEIEELLALYENFLNSIEHPEKMKFLEKKKSINYDIIHAELPQLLDVIFAGINKTSEIVKSLRLFAHQEETLFIESKIHEVIESSLIMLENRFKNCITIIKDYGPINTIQCNPGKVNQVFLNLFSNAIDAIIGKEKMDKEFITIKTEIQTQEKKEYLKITISDTGTGISEEHLKNIFDPFFTTKAIGKGTGLGLYISHKIIEEHNGSIQVTSSPNGTTFAIILPTHQEKK